MNSSLLIRYRMHSLCVLVIAVLLSGSLFGASPTAKRLIGSWKLISYELRNRAGEVSYPLGREAIGRITYDAAGRMSVQIMQPGRPTSEGGPNDLTPDQMVAAYRGYVAYFGTYTVDEARNVVIHKVEGSLYPVPDKFREQQRRYTFSGNRVTLEADLPGGHVTLVWERLP